MAEVSNLGGVVDEPIPEEEGDVEGDVDTDGHHQQKQGLHFEFKDSVADGQEVDAEIEGRNQAKQQERFACFPVAGE